MDAGEDEGEDRNGVDGYRDEEGLYAKKKRKQPSREERMERRGEGGKTAAGDGTDDGEEGKPKKRRRNTDDGEAKPKKVKKDGEGKAKNPRTKKAPKVEPVQVEEPRPERIKRLMATLRSATAEGSVDVALVQKTMGKLYKLKVRLHSTQPLHFSSFPIFRFSLHQHVSRRTRIPTCTHS